MYEVYNKEAMIEDVAKATSMSKKHGRLVVETILGGMVNHLTAGHDVDLPTLGTLFIKERPPRIGRNPSKGVRLQLPASRVLALRPSKKFTKSVLNVGAPAPIEIE